MRPRWKAKHLWRLDRLRRWGCWWSRLQVQCPFSRDLNELVSVSFRPNNSCKRQAYPFRIGSEACPCWPWGQRKVKDCSVNVFPIPLKPVFESCIKLTDSVMEPDRREQHAFEHLSVKLVARRERSLESNKEPKRTEHDTAKGDLAIK